MSESWIASDLPPIWRDGVEYFLLSHNGGLYLVANACPHRGGPLKSGFINADGDLVCPMHRGVFALDRLIARPGTIRLEVARGL
ncbi:Rieske (2Fe-2S) protein [uncultured Phenylobacterium sp.]|uniref:Rieske (2Fe-2S) protein n=1 Tax=uncultured Phenylobacterium sp. TaxID=349273 RepID=UPI0025EDB8F9|nr:Rieske (2Fe-2S) protein [uncultured Phenylobacterium sp.]